MKAIRVSVVVLSLLLGLAPLAAFAAEDDLFDTKAAAEHLEKGLTELKAKNYDAAVAEFEESASISPEAEAFYYLGYTYYMKGRAGDEESRKLSLENFDKAYEIDPNFTPTRYKPAEPAPAAAAEKTDQAPAQTPAAATAPVQSTPSGSAPAPQQPAEQTK